MKQNIYFSLEHTACSPCRSRRGERRKSQNGVTDRRPRYATWQIRSTEPEEKAGRFQVRTARVSIEGKVAPVVAYKAEIDLSDEGKIKMLDAYTRLSPLKGFDFTIGQMRVPFTIDAHRSPHQQYFANRSFIAKQVGNVRDVGATLGYKIGGPLPLTLQAGMFNGSGLTDQKDFWTKQHQLFRQAQWQLPKGFSVTLSAQKIRPEHISVNMYDGGITYQAGRWMIEAEYL